MKAFRCFFDQGENQMMWFYPVRSTLQITVLPGSPHVVTPLLALAPGAFDPPSQGCWPWTWHRSWHRGGRPSPLVSVVAAKKKRTEPDSHISNIRHKRPLAPDSLDHGCELQAGWLKRCEARLREAALASLSLRSVRRSCNS